jgi:hypothetical protein
MMRKASKLPAFPSGMRYLIRCFVFSGLIMAALPGFAQSGGPAAVDVAGQGIKIKGITHEYAIGQVMSGETHLSGALIVTPGVLQPVPRARFTPEKGIGSSEHQVYPDPVEGALYLQPAFRRGGTLTYGLYDAAGKLVAGREVLLTEGTERQDLNVSHISTGPYILRVTWAAGRATPRTSGYKIQKLR